MEYESEQRNKAIFPKRGRIETFFLEWGSKISWWEAAQDSLVFCEWLLRVELWVWKGDSQWKGYVYTHK